MWCPLNKYQLVDSCELDFEIGKLNFIRNHNMGMDVYYFNNKHKWFRPFAWVSLIYENYNSSILSKNFPKI